MKEMNILLRDGIDIVEEARRSVDRQNEINTAIKIELSRFSNDVNREFNELYNRICNIKKNYKERIEFLENMYKHYTDNLSYQLNAFSFDGMEIRQKLSKLEWDLIFLQYVGRTFIEASTTYLSQIHFDNIEQTLHKTNQNLNEIDNILTNNYDVSVAYDIALSSPLPVLTSRRSGDDNKFMEVLRLVYNSVQNLQRLPCTLEGTVDGEDADQSNLMDEANKLLTMCVNIQQKIMNAESTSPIESSAGSDTEAVSSEEDRIMNTSDLNSKEQ